MALNLAHAHAPRVHRHDLVVEAREATLVALDELWIKRSLPIAGNAHVDLRVLRQNRLLRITVAAVFARPSVVLIVTMNLAPSSTAIPWLMSSDANSACRRLDHHPRALLVGDRWFGKGRGAAQFAVIYTGEVLGGAFYFDGHLYRGVAGAGGELGHTFVQVEGELCRCGRRGCWTRSRL
jgi:hypothetical protein